MLISSNAKQHGRLSLWHEEFSWNFTVVFVLKKQPTIKILHNFMGMKYKMSKAHPETFPDYLLL
jgi:hypothetical protein